MGIFTDWVRSRGRIEDAWIWRSSRDGLTYEDARGRRVTVATERYSWGLVVYADTLQSWTSGADMPMTSEEHETVKRRVEQFLQKNRIRYEYQ